MTLSPGLTRLSSVMSWLAFAGAVLYPAAVVASFLFPDQTRVLNMGMEHLGAPLTSAVPLADRIYALLFEFLPTALASWSLIALARVFNAFRAGEVFSLESLKLLRQVTTALFLNTVAALFAQAPISYFLTHRTPHEHGIVSLGFGTPDIATPFLAGSTLVVARVLAEARRIAIENEAFV